jgi:hypothetical protein
MRPPAACPHEANPVRLQPREPGWVLALIGLVVVALAIGGVVL